MSPKRREMHFGVFVLGTGNHSAGWRYDGAATSNNDLSVIQEIATHGERDFPVEACGLVLGRPDHAELARVVPMKNVQDRYHARDPDAFPRDGRDA